MAERQTMQEFVRRHILRMDVKRDHNFVSDGDWDRSASHWRCTIHANGGKRLTVEYHMGSAHHGEPEAADVLNSLALDASSGKNASDWKDFAREFGYETEIEDPRSGRMVENKKAKKIYNACLKTYDNLVNLLGSELTEELLYQTEGL